MYFLIFKFEGSICTCAFKFYMPNCYSLCFLSCIYSVIVVSFNLELFHLEKAGTYQEHVMFEMSEYHFLNQIEKHRIFGVQGIQGIQV